MSSETPTPQQPTGELEQLATEEQSVQTVTTRKTVVEATVATSGKRQAFRDIRRQLHETELSSPGVQKLVLEDLERAESECEMLQGYVQRFHDADKRAAVLEERLRTQTAIEVLFGVGVTLGGALLGLAPSFWDHPYRASVLLAFGVVLLGGSIVARIIKR